MPHFAFFRAPKAALAPIAILAAALLLAGCGRRGALEAPPGTPGGSASSQQSGARLTPGLGAASSRQNAATRDPLAQTSRTGELEEDEAPIPAPSRPFILDSIL